jgi:hypothetical protein
VSSHVDFSSPVNQIDPTQIDSDGEDEVQFGRDSELISENFKNTVGEPSETESPLKPRHTMEFNPTFKSIGNPSNTTGQLDSMRVKSQTGGTHLDPNSLKKSSTFFVNDQTGRHAPFSLVAVGTHANAANKDQILIDVSRNPANPNHTESPNTQLFNPFNFKSESREEDPTTAEPLNAFGSMLDEPELDTRLLSKTLIGHRSHPSEADADDGIIPEDYVPRRRRCLTGFEFRGMLSEKYNELKESHGNDPHFYRNLRLEDQYLKPNVKPPISKISESILKDFYSRFAKGGSICASHFPKLIEEIYQFERRPTPNYLQCLYLMSKYDTNKDGKIDFGEFKAMMAEL